MDFVFESKYDDYYYYEPMCLNFINPKNIRECYLKQREWKEKFIEENKKKGLNPGEKEIFQKRLSLFEEEIKEDYIEGSENEIAKLEKLLKDGSL